MKTIIQAICDIIINNNKEIAKKELEKLGIDTTTQYSSDITRNGKLENIRELGKLGVDMTTEYDSYTERKWNGEAIIEWLNTEYWKTS